MNAGTGLVAVVSLLLALAGAGGAAAVQAGADSLTGTRSAASRLPDRGDTCPTWGCGENHNETLVSDATPVPQQADTLSRWLTSIQAFIFTDFSTYAPRPVLCEDWGCGMNHNETMVSDAPSLEQADTWGQWLTSVQAFVSTRFPVYVPGGLPCEDWGCGTNHNETMVSDAAR